MTTNDEVPAVRGIDLEPVSVWLSDHIGGATRPFEFLPLTGGHSNLTFLVTDGAGRRFVLRRPPTGPLLASAHDMAREHRIISAVASTEVPVPPALGLCEDDSVTGAPFYVMGHVEGHVLASADDVEAAIPEADRMALGHSTVDTLAALHAADPDEIGLGDLGKKVDYIPRQLRRWSGQWDKSKTRELPDMERVHSYLDAHVPEQIGAGIVHGDYRLGNCMSRERSIAAVLDWELCTLGDTMADVGYLMNDWVAPGEAVGSRELGSPSAVPGFPTRDDLIGRYADATGRDVSKVDYYRAFSYWRLAAIVEGVLARYLAGQMAADADTDEFRERVEWLVDQALEAIDRLESAG